MRLPEAPEAKQSPDPATFLDSVLQELRSRLREEQFATWFRGFDLVEVRPEEVEFSVPSGFVRDWLTRHYFSVLDSAVRAAEPDANRAIKLTIDRNADQSPAVDAQLRAAAAAEQGAPSEKPRSKPLGRTVMEPQREGSMAGSVELNGDYTFENFVVGPCNRLAHAACMAIGDNPGRAYNPLFVHGNVGLGKTHLLQATCHTIQRKQPSARVLYMSCEDFTNSFIQSIQSGRLEEFREYHRSIDVLVIDDIQFLAGKEKTQEEFFHTFNALYNTQRQIVISSDRTPLEIPTIEERLVSRFKWGLVADMEVPCFETRVAILKRKARSRGVEMEDDVAYFIAERVDTNIRELEGAVIKIIGVSTITDRKIDTALAEEALRGVAAARKNQVNFGDIMDLITMEFSLSARDITGKSRTQAVSLPRQIGMYLSRELMDHSLEEVGRFYGNRDHTTVLYAVQKIKKRVKEDRLFRDLINNLRSRLQSGSLR